MAIILLIALIVVLVKMPKGDSEGGGEDTSVAESLSTFTTEEEDKITQEILEKDAEVTIEGYQWIESEDGQNDVVVISVKNISDQKTNFAFNVVALDKDDNVLDKTSLYAEGIEPGQIQVFHAFALSELTAEQLKQAHYKVFRAQTYTLETDGTNTEETVTDNNEEANTGEEVVQENNE